MWRNGLSKVGLLKRHRRFVSESLFFPDFFLHLSFFVSCNEVGLESIL